MRLDRIIGEKLPYIIKGVYIAAGIIVAAVAGLALLFYFG